MPLRSDDPAAAPVTAGQGSEGGFVRVSMSFLTAEQVRGNGALLPAAAEGEGRGARRAEHKAAGKRWAEALFSDVLWQPGAGWRCKRVFGPSGQRARQAMA